MKRRLLAGVLTFVMVLSLLPTAVLAEETSGQEGEESTSPTVEDIYGNKWTFTTSVDNSTITMVQGENRIVAEFVDSTLTFTGSGTMPVLNDSTDAASGNQFTAYPWAGWKDSVTKIVIGDGITGVGAKSFITWPNVTTVELGKDVKTIGAGAFAQLTACTQFTVDASNTSFEAKDGVLYSKGQEKLYYYPCKKTETEFKVPDTVTELGYNAVCKNDSLQTVSFTGEEALHFGFGSMFGNTALTTVNLDRPNVTFDTLVFSNDTALKVVYCKTSEVKGAANKLMNDTQSGAVALLKGGEYNQKENGYIYAVDSENAIIYGYEGNETVLVLPNELGGKAVTVIAANTFANLDGSRKITKVTVPVNVKSIEPSAFLGGKDYHNYDSMLTDITILGTDVEIGSMAFARHQNLRIDMTKVTNLKADLNAFSSVSKIIVSKDAQKDMRTALAENSSVNQNTKVYIDTDENNAFYWHYVNGKWVIVSSGTSSFKDEQGLIYTVNYTVEGATVAATAAITGYNKPETSTATGLVIPKTLPFTDASGNEAQATVVSISGLRGYNNEAANNGIKTLTVKADLPSLNTTFVYWNDLETVNILGNVESLVNCFTGCSALKQVYFGDQENITFGSSAFGNVPHLGVIDLSNVKTVTMTSTPGYSNAITNFYSNTSGNVTMVYVGSEAVYQAINEVTVAGETKSGFDFTNKRNIVAVTNGGTFRTLPNSNTTLATPEKAGYIFAGWYTNINDENTKVEENTPLNVGTTYTAKWNANQYTITFDTDGGTEIAPITEDCGTAITSPAEPTKTGYTFAGWQPELPETMPAGNLTVKAQWKAQDRTIGAKLWLNGKEYRDGNGNQKVVYASGKYGETINFDEFGEKAIAEVKKTHSAVSYEAKFFEDSKSQPVCTTFGQHGGNSTHWINVEVTTTQKVVVYGLVNDEETTIWSGTAPTGSNLVSFLKTNEAIKLDKTGYTHKEWYKYDSPEWTFDNDATVDGWTNVLVKYTPNTYKVSFDANDGEGTMSVQDFTYDVEQPLSENTFTKANYTFSGWSTAKNGVKAYDDQQNVENLTADNKGTVTLYAVWTAKSTVDEFDGAVQSYTYDGTIKSYVVNSELKGFNVSYQQDGQTVTPKNVGTYDVVITRNEDDTYASFTQTIPNGLVINPADFPVSITANRTSMTGSGTVKLTVTCPEDVVLSGVTCSDDSIEVTTNANGTYSAYLPNVTKAYTFTVKIASGLDNYSDGLATCTVSVTRRHTSSVTPGNTVSVPSTPNGTVTVSPSTASKGETVTITTKPSEGYELGSIEVLDKNGDSLKLKDLGNGKYSFVMPDGKVSVEAEFVKTAATSFADVPANAYFADAVKWAVDKGITNGLSDTMFGPYESCTRAQIVTFLWRAAGSPEPKTASSFTDVPVSTYYAKAVAWAVENGITNGMTETAFAPNATCTRGQSVTFLHRALKGTASGSANFTDVKSDAFYADAVNWAVASDVTNCTSNTTFSPNADCTRAEIVTFLYRAYQGK